MRLTQTAQFKKDLKNQVKRGKDLEKVLEAPYVRKVVA